MGNGRGQRGTPTWSIHCLGIQYAQLHRSTRSEDREEVALRDGGKDTLHDGEVSIWVVILSLLSSKLVMAHGFVAGGNGSRSPQLQAQLAGKARLGSGLENQSALRLD